MCLEALGDYLVSFPEQARVAYKKGLARGNTPSVELGCSGNAEAEPESGSDVQGSRNQKQPGGRAECQEGR